MIGLVGLIFPYKISLLRKVGSDSPRNKFEFKIKVVTVACPSARICLLLN